MAVAEGAFVNGKPTLADRVSAPARLRIFAGAGLAMRQRMSQRIGVMLAAVLMWTAAAASAQQPSPAPDDDRKPSLAEPDFTLVNLPTTLVLPRHRGNFRLTHR